MGGNDHLFNILAVERERTKLTKHPAEKLQSLRAAWRAWDSTVPAIAEGATINLCDSVKDMPQR